jgi:hypothetical protein
VERGEVSVGEHGAEADLCLGDEVGIVVGDGEPLGIHVPEPCRETLEEGGRKRWEEQERGDGD